MHYTPPTLDIHILTAKSVECDPADNVNH